MDRNHRMELQYDGTGLHGWAKQEGLQTVEGCLEEAFRTSLGAVAGAAGRGADRRGGTCAPPGREPPTAASRGPGQAAPLSERPYAAGHRHPIASGGSGSGSTRARTRQAGPTGTLCRPSRCCRPSWTATAGGCSAASISRRCRRRRSWPSGRHHFTGFTPSETEHVFFDRTVLRCRWSPMVGQAPLGHVASGRRARRRRPVMSGDRGRRVPPPHGADARGHHGRSRPGKAVSR